jgi:threonine dehydrogenase-like Zn-dependent dehydrogenase
MADQVAVPIRNLHLIPDAIEDRRAVFIEPLAAAFRVIEQVDLPLGTTVAVVGDGKLGLLCAWVARVSGTKVTLVGKHPAKLKLAGEGIQTIELSEAGSLAKSFDVVIDATGSATGLPTALDRRFTMRPFPSRDRRPRDPRNRRHALDRCRAEP